MARTSKQWESSKLLGHHRQVTIRDIATATGLSIATVSMVLNKAARRISPATRQLVEETASKLGYFPNLQARSLRSRQPKVSVC